MIPSTHELADWLASRVAAAAGIEPSAVERNRPFAWYGLTSAEEVGLVGELESWLGRPLSPTLPWEYPTVDALARHLTEADRGQDTPPPDGRTEIEALVAELESLSEDEAAAELAAAATRFPR